MAGGPWRALPTASDGSSAYPGPYKATPEQQALFDKAVSCDGNTITYKLKKGIGDFNYAVTLGFSAVPNPTDHPGADTGEEYTNAPWSNGPYMIESYTPGAGGNLTLARNPNWASANDGGYRGAYPDKWVVEFAVDAKIADQRLLQPTGDDVNALQYGAIQPENLETVFSDANTAKPEFADRAFTDYDPYARYYWIRQDKVTNLKIRQAMAVALDRAAIRARAMFITSEIAGPAGLPGMFIGTGPLTVTTVVRVTEPVRFGLVTFIEDPGGKAPLGMMGSTVAGPVWLIW